MMWHVCITAFHLNSDFNRLHQLIAFSIRSDIFRQSLLERKQQSRDASQEWETCLNVIAGNAECSCQTRRRAYTDVCLWCSSTEPIKQMPLQQKPELGLGQFLCSRPVRHWKMKCFAQLKKWCGAARENNRLLWVALVWPVSTMTFPGSPSACLSLGAMAQTHCLGFSEGVSYTFQTNSSPIAAETQAVYSWATTSMSST